MNGNPNGAPKNRNVAPPKQINRVAAPIQVTPQQNGPQPVPQPMQQPVQPGQPMPQRVQGPVKQINRVVAPQQMNGNAPSALAQAAQNQSVRVGTAKKKPLLKKEHDASTMVFVVILLIILACLVAFIFYVILPRIEASKNVIEYNDVTTEKRTLPPTYPSIKPAVINSGIDVTNSGTFAVDSVFTLNVMNNGTNLEISINGKQVTSTKKIFSTVGRVEDSIIMILADEEVRHNRVVIYDKEGNLLKELTQFGANDGLLLMNEASSYIFSRNNLIMVTSRVYDHKVILTGGLGTVDGIDICDYNALEAAGVDKSFIMMANYSISYQGNNQFTDPVKISSVTLLDYRDNSRLCR